MRKSRKVTVAAVVVGLLMTVSSGSALAGWSWEDCPPGSANEFAHASDTATDHVWGLAGPKNANTHATSANPGNKFGDE